ncbi:spore gernimation protein [Paenibacillus selenitireducens]|uniref:Spore gernimation protein n=1 Tax=Paenibacillus selenitireducens TaxID=1324314 RepID=A0A1T2XD24_9BACL|nr:spore germination protein GerPB [Paenibacillus selenitireducens]OPA77781.1 spore gernimation protein [Paenibacillus selenitireducens]
MNLIVHQSITIQNLHVGTISNSSILQIGSTGVINPLSNSYNTGGSPQAAESESEEPLVPLPPPG